MADDVRRLSDELARDPGSRVFVPLGEALRRQGQLDLALKVTLRGLERHPHFADGHDLLAQAEEYLTAAAAQGDGDEQVASAIEHVREARREVAELPRDASRLPPGT